MEDPWASGSGWGSTSPKATKTASPSQPSSELVLPAPAATASRFEVSDPWGAPPPPSEARVVQVAPQGTSLGIPQDSTPIVPVKKGDTAGYGWGGWGDEASPSAGAISLPTTNLESLPKTDIEGERVELDTPSWGREEVELPAQASLHQSEKPSIPISTNHPASPLQPRLSIDENETAPPSAIPLPLSPEATSPARPSSAVFSPIAYEPPSNPEAHAAISTRTLSQAEPLSQLQSPSFGDEFGGFSSGFGDDPWGAGAVAQPEPESKKQELENSGWGESGSSPDLAVGPTDQSASSQDYEGGWGGGQPQGSGTGSTSRAQHQATSSESDWEEAQRRIRITEERAPRERIEGLKDEWRGLVSGLIGINKLEALSTDQEAALDELIRRGRDETQEVLRSLSSIPPNINIYPPVLSSLVTHERLAYALTRPNLAPATSLLTLPPNRQPRRQNPSDGLDSWTSRSRLGEPDSQLSGSPSGSGTAATAEASGSKWSWWKKTPAAVPLVTSGGGVLELKSAPAAGPGPSSLAQRTSTSTEALSRTSEVSRPVSPVPRSVTPGGPIPPDDLLQSAPDVTSPPPPPPSAVTRFFGRLTRRTSSQQSVDLTGDAKDLELSADDFSFLDQVPSLAPPEKGVGDLLSLEYGRGEQLAGLESMLKTKAVALPAPLAPPPMAGTASRSASGSGRFVARMANTPAPAPQQSSLDLLSGLDFGDGGMTAQSASTSTTMTEYAGPAPSSSAWDDFLGSQPLQPQQSGSTSRTGLPPPGTSSTTMTPPPVMPNKTSHGPFHNPPSHSNPQPSSGDPITSNDFDDFSDFGAVSKTTTSFDDFGDFNDFTSPTIPAAVQPSSFQTPPPSFHATRASLDHTSTITLLQGASATKGKQWPAPPSPLAPALEPPPSSSAQSRSATSAFPFLSPPPPGRPNSALGRGFGSGFGNLLEDSNDQVSPTSAGLSPIPKSDTVSGLADRGPSPAWLTPQSTAGIAPPIANPSRTSTPLSPASQVQGTGAKPGLSAQDLSFFDSL